MNNILSYGSKQRTKKPEEDPIKGAGASGALNEHLGPDFLAEDIFDAFEPGETLEPSESGRTIAVAWCVELEKAVHAEEVTRCQKENPGQELTFRCPECHVGLAFILRYEGVHARMYFVERPHNKKGDFISTSQRGTKDHRYCLMRTVETKWLPGASTERLTEIMSFRQFEKVFARVQARQIEMYNALICLQQAIESFDRAVPGLDQKKDATVMRSNMSTLHKSSQKKLIDTQQELYNLRDAYTYFRQDIRGY